MLWALVVLCFVPFTLGIECQTIQGCSQCTATAGCGYCWSSQQCLPGSATGPEANTCVDYAWFFGNVPCPDSKDGCQSYSNCSSCVKKDTCGWCTVGKGSCVYIDRPQGQSSQCIVASPDGAFGDVDHSCAPCQVHVSCLACQAAIHQCFWCPQEQLCLPVAGNSACRGLTSLQGNCRDCSQYSCLECQEQPDCTFCPFFDTCVIRSDCPFPRNSSSATCTEECALANTCEGCNVIDGCQWDSGKGKCIIEVQGATPTPVKQCPNPPGFDGGSFVGGMVLVLGLGAMGAVGVYFYRRHQRSKSFLVQ